MDGVRHFLADLILGEAGGADPGPPPADLPEHEREALLAAQRCRRELDRATLEMAAEVRRGWLTRA